MKPKMAYYPIICLILTVSYLPTVVAVTDAELKALEKQIEQQEAEEIKQAEDAEKKKAETAVKRKAEAESNRKAEEARLAELERQRVEEEQERKAEKARLRSEQETRAQAEAEAQREKEEKREQFSRYMKDGDSAMNNKEYTEALRVYTQALEIFPGDSAALSGQTRAREFQDTCAALVGEWDWFLGSSTIVSTDGRLKNIAIISNHGSWECTDPSQRKFTLNWVIGGWVDNVTLSADGNTVEAINNIGIRFKAWRTGTKKVEPAQEIPL